MQLPEENALPEENQGVVLYHLRITNQKTHLFWSQLEDHAVKTQSIHNANRC